MPELRSHRLFRIIDFLLRITRRCRTGILISVHQTARILAGTIDELFPKIVNPAVDDQPWRCDAAATYCRRCGESVGPGAATSRGCSRCLTSRLPWDRITRLGPYVEPMDDWIRQMKFRRAWRWSLWFGESLAERLIESGMEKYDKTKKSHVDINSPSSPIIVCPVPMHWFRRCRRGYNQAHLIAQALANAQGWPLHPVLRRRRYTRPQTSVAASQRKSNVTGSFALRHRVGWRRHQVNLKGTTIILVDDIKTSGATLSACARLLKKAGAARIEAAVAAVAEGHH